MLPSIPRLQSQLPASPFSASDEKNADISQKEIKLPLKPRLKHSMSSVAQSKKNVRLCNTDKVQSCPDGFRETDLETLTTLMTKLVTSLHTEPKSRKNSPPPFLSTSTDSADTLYPLPDDVLPPLKTFGFSEQLKSFNDYGCELDNVLSSLSQAVKIIIDDKNLTHTQHGKDVDIANANNIYNTNAAVNHIASYLSNPQFVSRPAYLEISSLLESAVRKRLIESFGYVWLLS
ncbi:hypothetical protein BKA69DRAFT_784212 [Paraphysoderma sedebokerense]|nr:hypothetical protein BKA69DRAFT_784212 [Paraphysoderma sedebokerense]